MLSNTRQPGVEGETLSLLYRVDGIHRSGQKSASGCPAIGKPAGFTGFNIARHEEHNRSRSVADKLQASQGDDKEQLSNCAISPRSLRSRRIYPVLGFIRLFFCHSYRGQSNNYWLHSGSAHRTPSPGHFRSRPCVIGDLAIFVQTGQITQSPSAASRRRRPLITGQKGKQAKKTAPPPVGNAIIIAGKAIFPDRDTVFFQLYFDAYGKNENYPAWQDTLLHHKPLHWPHCGGHQYDNAMTSYNEWQPGLRPHDYNGNSGRFWQGETGQQFNTQKNHPGCFYHPGFCSNESNSAFVNYRKSLFGFWNIKLLTAVLLFFLLIAGLDAFTGVHGYISINNLSASELLSGLMIALGMMVLALLLLCVLIK